MNQTKEQSKKKIRKPRRTHHQQSCVLCGHRGSIPYRGAVVCEDCLDYIKRAF